MKVKVKELNAEIELKNSGMELQIHSNVGKHLGSLVVNKTRVEWCDGRTRAGNGVQISWQAFIDYANALKAAPGKKAAAKKAAVKKTIATKAPAKKAIATKAPVKKAAVKKVPAKKAVAKKAAVKKVAVKKVAVKKAVAEQVVVSE
ncbi:hypothetical protein [Eoetvoesiella caeni]|uniref:Uncharacterized protein n=1 Tax=Eoetvoesiella caeni TaxID=645616 RepID=A0A366H7A6_9BURK|nr:hypothetical protein [Eoetvoesiella caeni]MCI2809926.1 hypothetical protein [Eoetvoesiella caeni]NYT55802.1 hypothetical protein [Eoetvoesiella caeni]RBP37588.1 hypothetical protein DFR37_109154 [Eoetvoesiella caeni]